MESFSDSLGGIVLSVDEQRLLLVEIQKHSSSLISPCTIDSFCREYEVRPMLVARLLVSIRGSDHQLAEAVAEIERNIKYFGRDRIPNEVMEGKPIMSAFRPREHDPLGVYRPGDLWYVDENHPWSKYFPVLILAPLGVLLLLLLILGINHLVFR